MARKCFFFLLLPLVAIATVTIDSISPFSIPPNYDGDLWVSFTSASESLVEPQAICRFLFANGTSIDMLIYPKGWQQDAVSKWLTCAVPSGFKSSNLTVSIDIDRTMPHLSTNTATLHVTGLTSIESSMIDEPATMHAAAYTFGAVDLNAVSTLSLVPTCPLEGCPTGQTCINDRCHLTAGLKVWIPGTNDALDHSGNGYHGLLAQAIDSPTPFSIEQKGSLKGISLPDETALFIPLVDPSFLSGCLPRTISLRVWGDLYGGANTHLVTFGDVSVASQGFQFYASGGNGLGFASQDIANGELASNAINVLSGSSWSHVAVTVGASCRVQLFKDGTLQVEMTSAVNVNMASNVVKIGSKDWSTRYDMWVADIRIYNRALSTPEIQILQAESMFEPTGANAIHLSATVLTATTGSATASSAQYKARTYVAYLDGVRQPEAALTLPLAIYDIVNAAGFSLTEASAGESVTVNLNGPVPANGVLRCRFGAAFVSQGLFLNFNPNALSCIVPLISANAQSDVLLSVSVDGSTFTNEVPYRVLNKVASVLQFADLHDAIYDDREHKLMANDQPIQGIVQVKNPDDLLLFVYTAGVSGDQSVLKSWLSINMTDFYDPNDDLIAYGTFNQDNPVDTFFSSIGAYVVSKAGTHIGGLAYLLDAGGGPTVSGYDESVSSSVSWVVLHGALFHSSPIITSTFFVEPPATIGAWSEVFVNGQLTPLSHTIALQEPTVLLSFYKFTADKAGAPDGHLQCTQIINGSDSAMSGYITDAVRTATMTCSGFSAARYEPGNHTLEFMLEADIHLDSTDDLTYMFNVLELSVKDGAEVYESVLDQAVPIQPAVNNQWNTLADPSVQFTLPRARSLLFYYNFVVSTPDNNNILFQAKVNGLAATEAMTASTAALGHTTQATWIQRLAAGTHVVSLEYMLSAAAPHDVIFLAEPRAACSLLAIVLPETTVIDVLPSIAHTGYVGSVTVGLNSAARAAVGVSRCLFNNTFTSIVTSIDSAANTVTCNVPFVLAPGNLSVEVSLDGLSYSMDSNVFLLMAEPTVSVTLTSLPNVIYKYDPSVHTVNLHANISWSPTTYSSDNYRSTWAFSGDDSNFHYLTSKYNSTYIVIAPNSFQAGTAQFTFSYVDARGLTSVQTIVITINSPPTGGTFVCSPTSGVALATNFTLTMASWADTDGGLSYAFAVLSSNSAREVLLHPASSQSSVSLPLPSGSAAKGYTVTLVGYIYDLYGMATRVTTNVTVNGASVSKSVIQNKVQTLQASVGLMSTSDALQTIAVLGTTMLEVWTDRTASRTNFDTVFSVLSNVSSGMSSADAVQAIDTLRLLTSQPTLLTNNSQITAASILNSTLVFAAAFPYSVDPSTVLNTVSNIASAVELTAEESNSSSSTGYESGVYSALGSTVNTLAQIVGSTLVPYQSSATTSSKANLTIEYAPASSLVSRNLTASSSGSSFTAYIPQAIFADQALASNNTPVFGVLLEFDFNPYSNSSGSANLTSSTTELTFYAELSTSAQTPLAIQGLSSSSPILLYIPLANNTNTSSVSCQFLNTSLDTWQTSGCSVHSATNDTCVCACTHTTVFAVAGSVWSNSNIGVIENFDKIGNILSAVGLYVFAAASVLYIALVSWGKKKDQREWEKLDIHDDDSDEESEPSMFQMLREHFCAGSKHRSGIYAAPSTTNPNTQPDTPMAAYNSSGKQDGSISHVVPRLGFKFASPQGSPRIEIKPAASSRHVSHIRSNDPEIGEDEAPFIPLKLARSPRAADVEELPLPHSLTAPPNLSPDCTSPVATSRSIDLSVGSESRRSLEESENASLIQVPSSTADGEFQHPLKRKMTLKRVIAHVKEEHLLLSVIFYTKKEFSRPARVTLYFCIVLSHLVAAALFYNADEDACGEPICSDDVGFFDGVAEFGWSDFWVSVYSILITIPVNMALMRLFKSKRIVPGSSAASRARILKSNLRRRRVAYTIAAIFASFCAFYLIMFTLSFNIRVSYRWITSWAVASLQDLAVWENASIVSKIMLMRYILGPLFLYRMVELSYKRRQARQLVTPLPPSQQAVHTQQLQ